MEVSFDNEFVIRLCEDEQYASKELGSKTAQSLQNRISDLESASNIYEVPIGNIQIVSTLPDGCCEDCTIDIGTTHTMTFRQIHGNPPMLQTGVVDWSNVSRIKILKIDKNG